MQGTVHLLEDAFAASFLKSVHGIMGKIGHYLGHHHQAQSFYMQQTCPTKHEYQMA
jgi:hypothetical protein